MTLEEPGETRTKQRLTQEEKSAYCRIWESSGLSKRAFCRREGIAIGSFLSWFKGYAGHEGRGNLFIPVQVIRKKSIGDEVSKELIFSFPNGLSVAGTFSCNDFPLWLKELSDALTTLR